MMCFKPEMIERQQQKRLEVLFILTSSILACRHLNRCNKQAENEWVTHVTFSILQPWKWGTVTYNPEHLLSIQWEGETLRNRLITFLEEVRIKDLRRILNRTEAAGSEPDVETP